MNRISLAIRFLSVLILPATAAPLDVPAAIAVPDEAIITTIHAEGAQVYECKPDAAGKTTWQFREPIATLFKDGKTVGRHYAGPSWELADGSVVTAKLAARTDGATAADIPLLKLEVISRRGTGDVAAAGTILRVNTRGGTVAGACQTAGAFLSVPYSADYAFYKKRG